MMQFAFIRHFITILFVSTLLNACTQYYPNAQNQAVCTELKHQIIVNGATSDPQAYMQDKAALGNIEGNYRAAGCT